MISDRIYALQSIKEQLHFIIQSGAVIFHVDLILVNDASFNNRAAAFFQRNNICTTPETITLTEISAGKAHELIKNALHTYLHTAGETPTLSASTQNKLIHSFFQLFEHPKFFTIQEAVYKTSISLYDFWKSGGALVMDEFRMGIFYVADLYEK